MQEEGDSLFSIAKQLFDEKEYRKSLTHCLRGVWEFRSFKCAQLLLQVTPMLDFTEQERSALLEDGDASSLFLAATLIAEGSGGFECDRSRALAMFSEDARLMEHPYAIMEAGNIVGDPDYEHFEDNGRPALAYFIRAANLVARSCRYVGVSYDRGDLPCSGPLDNVQLAALYLARGVHLGDDDPSDDGSCAHFLWWLNQMHVPGMPRSRAHRLCPWGCWKPRAEYQALVPQEMHRRMRCFLLCMRRSGAIVPDVQTMVLKYICTRD